MRRRNFLDFLQEHLGVIGYTILAIGCAAAIFGVQNLAYRNCDTANKSKLADRNIYKSFREQILAGATTAKDREGIIVFFNKALGVPFNQQTDPTVDWAKVGHKANRECRRLW
jgi:hypothetical protein